MPEFMYRGYRVRTLFEKHWQIRVWPPVSADKLINRVQATRAEGEDVCRLRATAMIDSVLKSKSRGKATLES
jgi:hypothetical protein